MPRIRLAIIVAIAALLSAGLWAQDEAGRAREDLARRLQVKPEQITITGVEEVTWQDTSLGCPQPDKMYAQVLIPGYRILLVIDGEEYEYHSDRKGQVVYCARHILTSVETPAAVELARQDLARRLGCTPAEIAIVEAPFVEWPTADPAQPPWERERPFPKSVQPGYRAVLRCEGKEYEYRTDLLEEAAYVRELPEGAPESYRIAYLRLSERPDGHNLWDLVVRNSITGEITVPVLRVVDFAIAPDSGRIICLRRQGDNRFALVSPSRPHRPILTAANMQGLGWDATGRRYVAWVQDQETGPWRLVVGEPGQKPTIVNIPGDLIAPGVPSALMWQGHVAAFTFADVDASTSFVLRWPQAQLIALQGRFMGWLDEPGHYLVIDDGRFARGSLQDGNRLTVVTVKPDLVWARPLPQSDSYLAMTQEGSLLRLWQGQIGSDTPPRLVSELEGQLVQAQLAERGTLLMVQQVNERVDPAGRCKVTLVETRTGNLEPLSGVCLHAQLLPLK